MTFLEIYLLMSLFSSFSFQFFLSLSPSPSIHKASIYACFSKSRCINESGSRILDSLINIVLESVAYVLAKNSNVNSYEVTLRFK